MNSKQKTFTLGELGEFIPITEVYKEIKKHHLNKNNKPSADTENKNVFNMNELIEYLKPYNPKISRSTIDKWLKATRQKRMKFPFHKKGRRLYFFKEEIDNWLKSQR